MNTTTQLLVMENARMRLHARLHVMRRVLQPDDATLLRELLHRLTLAPQEGLLYGPVDGINFQYRHIDVSRTDLDLLRTTVNTLRAEDAHLPQNIGELRVWDTLMQAISATYDVLDDATPCPLCGERLVTS